MLPHKNEVVVLKASVKNCYGCGSSFVDKYRRAQFNLVIEHVDRDCVHFYRLVPFGFGRGTACLAAIL